jgi:VWFA-related protein
MRTAALAIALAASVAPAAAPQSAAQQQSVDLPKVFSETIDVRVVNVEVVVTDAEGKRIPGLARDEFRVQVDGAERPIDFFTEVRDGQALARAARDPASSPPPTAAELDALDALEAEGGHSTSYLVYIDDSFLHSRDRNLVLEKLAKDLDGLAPDSHDRIAVVAFDGRELTLLTPWTTSMRVVAGALRDARARPTGGNRRDRERRLNEANHAGYAGRELSGLQHRYASQLGTQVERSVMAAVASLRTFSSPPGRKVMLLLAGAWPLSPAEFAAAGGAQPEALEDAYRHGVLGYEALYGPLVDTANLLGYTLYPVDVAGIAGTIDPETPLGLLHGSGDQSFLGPEGNLHAGMRFLAEKTGGRPLIKDEREQALAGATADTRSYYWLGLRIDRAADDRRHRIEVEVRRPGLVVRSREGFVDPSRETEMTLQSESALLFGTPASALAAQLKFDRPQRLPHGQVKLHIDIGFPLDQVALATDGDHRTADLALRVVAMDDEGVRTEPMLETVHIDLEHAPRPGEVYWHPVELTLERRWHRIVAGVFDPRSGSIYSSSAEIAP